MVLPIGSGVGKIDYRFDLRDEYVKFMEKCVPVDLKGMKIVVDCAEGASHYTSVKTLTDLGADLVAIHTDPDGTCLLYTSSSFWAYSSHSIGLSSVDPSSTNKISKL